ncbi:MAG: hypothetical protein FWG31_09070 [Oscillospiraceae bacterium]|nr:hypothetical protein [Oscillospiraceae bacterium]
MKKTKISAILLAISILFSLSANASTAISSEETVRQQLREDIRAVAVNAPSHFNETAEWQNIKIVKETPLYDLEGTLIAYCMDLQNADTGENAYIIINNDRTDFPILQYAPTAVSPYFNVKGTALYLAAGLYGIDSGVAIKDLSTGETINKKDIMRQEADTMNDSISEAERENKQRIDYSGAWELYTSGVSANNTLMRNTPVTVILNNVPNWQWYVGCSPTAIGMQLAAIYPNLSSSFSANLVIGLLSTYMGTASDGSTPWANHGSGAQRFLFNNGFGTPSFCDWHSKNANGIPNFGAAHNSYSTYIGEINAGRAVSIVSLDCTISTATYQSGWRSHMVTGIGYSYVTGLPWQYVIVHTTSVRDGQVYLFLDHHTSQYAWFIVRP